MSGVDLVVVVDWLVRVILAMLLFRTGWWRIRQGVWRQARRYLPIWTGDVGRWLPVAGSILLVGSVVELAGAVALLLPFCHPWVDYVLAVYFVVYAGMWTVVTPWWDVRHLFFRLFLFVVHGLVEGFGECAWSVLVID